MSVPLIPPSRVFILQGEYIELYKLLKLESIATSGGEAKMMVAKGAVMLNGEKELQKRKKLREGDVIEIAGERIKIVKREND